MSISVLWNLIFSCLLMREYWQFHLLFLPRILMGHDRKFRHYLFKVTRSLHVFIVVHEFGRASPYCLKHVLVMVVVWTEFFCISHHVLVVSQLDRLSHLRCLWISLSNLILLLCACLVLLLLNWLRLVYLPMTAETNRFLHVACSVTLNLLLMDNLVVTVVYLRLLLRVLLLILAISLLDRLQIASIGRLCLFVDCPENVILVIIAAAVISLPY